MAQPVTEPGEICFGISDAQRVVRQLTECGYDRKELDLLREQLVLKDQRIAQIEKENDLLKQEVSLHQQIVRIKDMELESNKRSFDQLNQVTNQAIKFSEVGKPQTGNLMLYGVLGVAAMLLGALLAK